MKYSIAAALISLLTALFLTPLIKNFAIKRGIVAKPGGRRIHDRPTPLLGGVAMYAGFVIAVIAILIASKQYVLDKNIIGILIGCTFVALVGVLDDKYELPGWVQAGSIVVAAGILIAFNIRIMSFTNPFMGGKTINIGLWFSIPATILWILMVTKAVDCMDGMDGLAAGISAIAAGTLMLMALNAAPKSVFMIKQIHNSAILSAAIFGACIGFLRYNYPPAKIFMGTVGSQFLGFSLAAVSLAGTFKIATLIAFAAPVLVLGVPLFDTTFVVLKRMVDGKAIHEADKTHLHHRLQEKGLTTRQVIWTIYGITFALCAAGYYMFMHVK